MRKDVIIAVLATFCLTATLFMISSSVGYDPWADTNDDGKIDMKDIGYEASLFGTRGDSTKNVTIAGHITESILLAENVLVSPIGEQWSSDWLAIDGYSKVTVLINVSFPVNGYQLWAKADLKGSPAFWVDFVGDFPYYLVRTYDVMNRYIQIWVINEGGAHMEATVQVYLVA